MANPVGSENVSATVKEPLARAIDDLAKASGLTRSSYVRAILEDAVKRRRTFRMRMEEFIEETGSGAGGAAPNSVVQRIAKHAAGFAAEAQVAGLKSLPSPSTAVPSGRGRRKGAGNAPPIRGTGKLTTRGPESPTKVPK